MARSQLRNFNGQVKLAFLKLHLAMSSLILYTKPRLDLHIYI